MPSQKTMDARPYDLSKLTKEMDAAIKRLSFCDCPTYWCDHALAIAAELEAVKMEERKACAKVASDHAKVKGAHTHEGFKYCVEQVANDILSRGEA